MPKSLSTAGRTLLLRRWGNVCYLRIALCSGTLECIRIAVHIAIVMRRSYCSGLSPVSFQMIHSIQRLINGIVLRMMIQTPLLSHQMKQMRSLAMEEERGGAVVSGRGILYLGDLGSKSSGKPSGRASRGGIC